MESQIKTIKGPYIAACLLVGMGMGGFIDGIVLHQILQWHQMISNKLPPDTLLRKNVNMFWDGIFHVFTWILSFTGIVLILKNQTPIKNRLSIFTGAVIAGWGIFNFLDSILNHYIFKLHNLRENTTIPEVYNHSFLIFSMILMLSGFLILKKLLKTT